MASSESNKFNAVFDLLLKKHGLVATYHWCKIQESLMLASGQTDKAEEYKKECINLMVAGFQYFDPSELIKKSLDLVCNVQNCHGYYTFRSLLDYGDERADAKLLDEFVHDIFRHSYPDMVEKYLHVKSKRLVTKIGESFYGIKGEIPFKDVNEFQKIP